MTKTLKRTTALMLTPLLLMACAPAATGTQQAESNPLVTKTEASTPNQPKLVQKKVVSDTAVAEFMVPEGQLERPEISQQAEALVDGAAEEVEEFVDETKEKAEDLATDAKEAVLGEFEPLPYLSDAPVRQFSAPQQVIEEGREYRAVLDTERGPITLELDAEAAPQAVNNFVFLALHHFYDGVRFHRVVDGFMAQTGDPLSADAKAKARWGTGGPGYSFRYEVDGGPSFGEAGVLGMARSSSPDSQGSQFFVTLADASFLDGQYTAFGKVVDGMDNLRAITITGENFATGAEPDTLNSVEILVR